MKRILVSLFILSLLFLTSACNNGENDAKNLAQAFIHELYTIDAQNADVEDMTIEELIDFQDSFSSYFTKKEFDNLAAIRFFTIPLEVANRLNNNLSVQDISIEKSDDQNFDHTFTLVFTDQDGNKLDEEEMKGQMTIIDTENGLKIDRYYDAAEKTLVNK